MQRTYALLFALLLSVVTLCKADCDASSFYDGRFTRCQVLNTKYNLYWVIDGDDITLGLNLHDTTYNNGWMGLGISVNGGMQGADIAVARKVKGHYVLEDRFATQFAEPAVDDLQNLKLIKIETSSTTGTTVIYSRKLVPCDVEQDQPILANATQVIFAYGQGDIQYHGTNRGTAIIFFHYVPPTLTLPSDTQTLNITMPNYQMPAKDTTYTCTSTVLPFTDKVHIISWRPIIKNPQYIHHMVLFSCLGDLAYAAPTECPMSPLTCTAVQVAWTLGQAGDDFVGDYALPAGGDSGVKFIVLQIHYNNPDMVSGVQDSSGIALFYTSQLRTYDVGVVPIALQAALAIPPQLEEYYLNSQCYGECTQTIPAAGINMINWFPHMHQLGSKIWLQHFRNGVELPEIHRDDHYDFARQQNFPVSAKIMPGDTLRMNCIWNSMSRTNITSGGESSSQEMCIGIFQYYPKTTAFTRCTDYHNIASLKGYAICTSGNTVKLGSTNYTAVAYPGNFTLLATPENTCPANSSAASVVVSLMFVVVFVLSLLL